MPVLRCARMRQRRAFIGVVLAWSTGGCSSKDTTTINLVTGEETNVLTGSPAVAKLQVDDVELTGDGGSSTILLATATLPASSLDLGLVDEGTVGVLTATGYDSSGAAVVFGATPPVAFEAIANGTLPIFIQRKGEFARLPNPPSDSRQAPTLAGIESRYLFIGGGHDASGDASVGVTTELYDFLNLEALTSPPTLPRAPDSIAFDSAVAWLIDGDGGTYFDFSSSEYGDIALSTGSFANVAGGVTVADDSGAMYVVGGTRRTTASSSVLKIDPGAGTSDYPYGAPTWLSLTVARLGASAAWVTGRGLVVCGGSADGAGAEILSTGATASSAVPYPADASVGSGAVALDGTHLLLAGGLTPAGLDAGVRVLDLSCASSCAPASWPGLPVPIGAAQAFVDAPRTSAIVVGSEVPSGRTRVYAVSSSSVREIPTKVEHANARAAVSPSGTLVLFGGRGEIESLTP
jgi:hypothetical protein